MSNDKILIVDDEKSLREFLSIMLKRDGYEVHSCQNGEEALAEYKKGKYNLVISDVNMPKMDGLELLKNLKEFDENVVVIMVTAYASVDTAVEAMKLGAYDYFTKPFNIEDIKLHIKRAMEWNKLSRENKLLKKEIKSKYSYENFIGKSNAINDLSELIQSVAKTKANVFIIGESGTGKEVASRAIHYESDRSEMPFVAINCGALPEELIESEIFGHQKGAFTGAVSNKEGLAEMADGGTLFLDEITEMPLNLQVKLLRFLQEKNFRRVGGTETINVDIRIIAASNRDVEEEVKNGKFREDLYYRLNVIEMKMPPLRERLDDVPLLANHFLKKFTTEFQKEITHISKDAMNAMVSYAYPGNVRELENAVQRAVAIETTNELTIDSLPGNIKNIEVTNITNGVTSQTNVIALENLNMEDALNAIEKKYIEEALKEAGGVKKKAAELLGITFRSFRYRLDKFDDLK